MSLNADDDPTEDRFRQHESLLRHLTTLVVKLDARDDQIEERLGAQHVRLAELHELQRQQMALNERLTTAIERLDVTLAAIKDLLGRGNGH